MKISKYLAPLLVAPVLSLAQPSLAQKTEPDLNKKLTLYVKPAVVRVASTCKVDYRINPNSFEKKFERLIPEELYDSIPIGLSFVGTGFIINPNGYIVTSSKVFQSESDCKDNLLRNIQNKLKRHWSIDEINFDEIQKLGSFDPLYKQEVYLPYASNNPQIFENNKSLEVKMSARDPGKPFESDKDIAVIKVALENAPVLKLGDSSKVEIQDRILTVGYPNADLNEALTQKSYLEASVQEGTISNPNKEIESGYPILQIDVRATDGSAGSPVINNKGEVVGVIKTRKDRNSSSYIPIAMPTSKIQEFIRQSGATNQQGETDQLYRDGLQNLWKGNYQEAKAKFLKVKGLYPFHSEVDRLISEIDQIEAERWAKPWKNPTYIFSAGLLLATGVVGGIAYFLLKQKSNLATANAGVKGSTTGGNSVFTSSFENNGRGKKCSIEMEYKGQIQRFKLNRDEHHLGRDPSWSDFDLPSSWEVVSRQHAIFKKEGEDYRIFDGDGKIPSRNGLWVNDDYRVDPQEGYLLNNGDQLKIGQDASEQILLTYYNPNSGQANLKSTMYY